MWSRAAFLVMCYHLISGQTTTPEYKGCYSFGIVYSDDLSFYYQLNQSMTIEQGFATCNHRLTRYVGLQFDELSANTFVYCGNDLAEVSDKHRNRACPLCPGYVTFRCGEYGSVAVYKLRESTPLALLLSTSRGVVSLIDNTTTVQVPLPTPSNDTYRHVDYIYVDDSIVLHTDRSVMRSVYNNTLMEYSKPSLIYVHHKSIASFVVDFSSRSMFMSTNIENRLYLTSMDGSEVRKSEAYDNAPEHVQVDPFNRIVFFVQSPYGVIHEWVLDDNTLINHTLNHLKIPKIKLLAMDVHNRYLYAIVDDIDGPPPLLVRMDHKVTKMTMVYKGPELENATALEVFRDHAAWLTNKDNVSTIFKCKLSPYICYKMDLTSYASIETIYDFTIYHPEKQTPGWRQVCAGMACSHGCQLYSPFFAKCTCPPGIKQYPFFYTCVIKKIYKRD